MYLNSYCILIFVLLCLYVKKLDILNAKKKYKHIDFPFCRNTM